jgi:hypothetical protein
MHASSPSFLIAWNDSSRRSFSANKPPQEPQQEAKAEAERKIIRKPQLVSPALESTSAARHDGQVIRLAGGGPRLAREWDRESSYLDRFHRQGRVTVIIDQLRRRGFIGEARRLTRSEL